jgi:hypothetical protein
VRERHLLWGERGGLLPDRHRVRDRRLQERQVSVTV